ncbi:non-ribosomal peptide synthetase/type I polyketide synthase [Staphylospora marina]|uniref:non-ribosomal peptide synthetase/type I polyketide synthase n=1 Tax=Staphylospora marina TaxID=2490858 RepID=UPI000F5C2484|nr:non-ribosomal peptide synthetase/type I polyketide synthase [Staphylospora marina]
MTASEEKHFSPNDIAIIGMAGRFPGAKNLEEYWNNLKNGVESVTFFSEEELLSENIPADVLRNPHYVKASPVMEDIDRFDAAFFGYNPREASLLDPQQRVFLELAWEALEKAGYDPGTFDGLIGVYAGAGMPEYFLNNLLAGRGLPRSAQGFDILINSDKDYLSTRVAYKLNLTGPGVNVQTACSTSLVAVHLACQALIAYDCDMALAGGVSIRVPQKSGYLWQDGTMFSPDGHCRPFDADAKGTIFGSGAGIVVLRRLEDAMAAGDRIEAVIKASAVNNDGSWKVGYTAPSVEGQTQVLVTALEMADIDPESVGVIEAHGTGTALGDPIEIEALTRAYGSRTDRKGYCAVSSVKGNIGHLEAAAGVAGLIKAVLQVKHGLIVPNINFTKPNPAIDFENTPFYVNTELKEWPKGNGPRRAAVSSFGIGGTNAHVILEQAPEVKPVKGGNDAQLIVLSAKTPSALEQATTLLADHLAAHPEQRLADVAHTLQTGRQAFRHRRIVVAERPEDAAEALRSKDPRRVLSFTADRERDVVFLFPGQGSQYPGMTRELYESEPVFRNRVDACADLLKPHMGVDLRELLYPEDPGSEDAAEHLKATAVAQPALFTVSWALAGLLESWGIRPKAMLGHSIGEYAAACLAGVLSLEDALRLVAIRGRLMNGLPSGSMLSVALPESEVKSLLTADLSVAAVNAPDLCVVSGTHEAVDRLEKHLREKGVACRRLHTSHAFHSAMMDPVLEDFRQAVRGVTLHPPNTPYVSNVTGTWITAEQATDPDYWVTHLRETVRFGDGVAAIAESGPSILLEVGPGQTLGTLARQCLGTGSGHVILQTVRHPQDGMSDVRFLLTAAGRLWMAGGSLDWKGLHRGEPRFRVELPSYPFERRRYWIEPQGVQTGPMDFTASEETDAEAEAAASGEFVLSAHHPRPPLASEFVAPRDERERLVAEIWQDFLGVAPVGVHDNFFELGGHSLLAAQVLGKVSERLGKQIPLSVLMENPTIAGLMENMENIGEQESDSLEASLPELVPEPDKLHEPFPLREMQQAQWIGRLGGFNVSDVAAHVYFEIDSDHIDLDRLNAAWQKVMERHPMLRTVILPDGRQQILDRPPRYEIRVTDIRQESPEEKERHLKEVRDRLSHIVRPVDQWPLFEICATRIDDRKVRLHLSFELIITDIGSIRILLRDWHRCYKGKEELFEALPFTFRDYVLAEQAIRDTPVYQRSLEYWQERVKTLPPAPDLPMKTHPETIGKPTFSRIGDRLSPEAWERLKQKAARCGVTPSAVLTAAYSQVLAAWSKNQHFSLNLTVINRMPFHPQVRNMVGEFGTFNLLEVNAADPKPFEDFVRDVQKQIWRDLEHRAVSGVRVLRELARVQGGTSGAVMPVVFTSTIVQDTEPDDVLFDWLGDVTYMISQTPQVWLDHAVIETRRGLELSWVVLDGLFPDGMVEDMFSAYCRFLNALADGEDTWKSSRFDWLPERQRRIREQVNATEGPVPDALLQEPFLKQAARKPDHPAVISASGTVTYGELLRRANRIGRQLRGLGARPNHLVGIAVRKGWEQVAAVLGVLQSGAAYLPIDPDLPEERQRYLIEHGQVKWLITLDGEPLPAAGDGVHTLAAASDGWEGPEGEPLEPVARPDDLAYVIYTSGSTGLPKGVAITHRAALNTILDINERFGVGEEDAVLALSSLSFDLSVYDVFGLLAAGGTIVMPESGAGRDPARWIQLIREHRVTVWNTVPALMEMLAEHALGQGETGLPLKVVMMSGDWIPVQLPDRIRSMADGARIWSLGGATEASIWSIHYPITEVKREWESIPYGVPLRNQTFHVLNERMDPSPEWVPGQLYIGGVGLAQEYWRDQEKTDAGFIRHPVTGERLYRTGDLGRYLPDGNIEFLGREDFQVKIRGFRIELGEIEAAITGDPGVRTAVVAAVGTDRSHLRLAAFVVPEEPFDQPDGEEASEWLDRLKQHVAENIPSYMVPVQWLILDQLPLSSNGKVDRKALNRLAMADSQGGGEAAGETADELAIEIASVVADVLGTEHVGLHQNFFEMGGDSIMAIQIISRLNARGIEVTPQDVFAHQTIAELSRVVRKKEPMAASGQTVPVPAEQVAWIEAGPAAVGQLVLDVPEDFDSAVAERALAVLLRHHDALRLRVFRDEKGWMMSVADPDDFEPYIPLIDLSAFSEGEREAALDEMLEEMRKEMDLTRGPLLSTALFDLGDGIRKWVWHLHRLAADTTSWSILLRDVSGLYEQLRTGADGWLAKPAVEWGEWMKRLAERQEESADREIKGELIAGQSETAPMAVSAEGMTARGVRIHVRLSREETEPLLGEAAAVHRVSVTELTTAALTRAWKRLTGDSRFLFGLERERRGDREAAQRLRKTVGGFSGTVSMKLEVVDQSAGAWLAHVKDQVRGEGEDAPARVRILRPLMLDDWREEAPLFGIDARHTMPGSGPMEPAWLEIVPVVANDELRFVFLADGAHYTEEAVRRMADAMLAELRELAADEPSVETALSPEDFADAGLDREELLQFLQMLNGGDEQ